jgi:hypothetical protein
MKKFNELSREEFCNIVKNSKELCEKLYECISDIEMNFIGEKLSTIDKGLRNWSVGSCNNNYLLVGDASAFLDGVKDSIEFYGGSDKLMKAVNHCTKLEDTNLFEFQVKNLSEIYLKEELQPICDYIDDCYDETHGYGEFGKLIGDYLDTFLDYVGEYLYDEENKHYYTPTAINVA